MVDSGCNSILLPFPDNFRRSTGMISIGPVGPVAVKSRLQELNASMMTQLDTCSWHLLVNKLKWISLDSIWGVLQRKPWLNTGNCQRITGAACCWIRKMGIRKRKEIRKQVIRKLGKKWLVAREQKQGTMVTKR